MRRYRVCPGGQRCIRLRPFSLRFLFQAARMEGKVHSNCPGAHGLRLGIQGNAPLLAGAHAANLRQLLPDSRDRLVASHLGLNPRTGDLMQVDAVRCSVCEKEHVKAGSSLRILVLLCSVLHRFGPVPGVWVLWLPSM